MRKNYTRLATTGLILILILCLVGCSLETPLTLREWRSFRREMLAKYRSIDRLIATQNNHQLTIWCYYGDISDSDKENLKKDLKAFLSSEEFLSAYIPYAREKCVPEEHYGLQEPLPDIYINLATSGSNRAEWMSEAGYYTISYRSNVIMEIDNYQTWHDFDWDRHDTDSEG